MLDLCAELWQARVAVLFGGFVALGAAFVFLLAAVPAYRAVMIVSPANTLHGAESSSLMADDNLYALRYLVQRVGGGNSSDFARFENIYNGGAVASALLADPNVRAGLELDRMFSVGDSARIETPEEMAEYVRRRVGLEPVGATFMRRMVYRHPHPEFAKYFLHVLHKNTDEIIRSRVRYDTEARVAYLQQELIRNTNPEHKRALAGLLMEQERLRMMVSIDMPYAASVVEMPSVGARSDWPKVPLVIAGFVFSGMVFGFAVHGLGALLRHRRMAVRVVYDLDRRRGGGWMRGRRSNQNEPSSPQKSVLFVRDSAE